ncbi:MAG: hypothetical protein H0W50_04945 [Parachlamydiaceae bacterium]|nr:hypothetical protein [Parachlamydiaceae bacterium]
MNTDFRAEHYPAISNAKNANAKTEASKGQSSGHSFSLSRNPIKAIARADFL